MRMKAILLAATLLAMGMLAPGVSQADTTDEAWQVQGGEVMLPTRFVSTAAGATNGAWPGLGRRLWLASSQTNGLIASVFNIDQETLGGRFELTLTGDDSGMADLGIYFYTEFGDVGGDAAPETTGEYDKVAPGGETGAIPLDARKAVVFMKMGLNARFTYTGFLPAHVEITAGGFTPATLEVLAGQKVVFTNTDENVHSVTSDLDFGGAKLFDSSPKANQPLVEGATFTYTFYDEGTFTYFDRYTGATGTVVVTGAFGYPA